MTIALWLCGVVGAGLFLYAVLRRKNNDVSRIFSGFAVVCPWIGVRWASANLAASVILMVVSLGLSAIAATSLIRSADADA